MREPPPAPFLTRRASYPWLVIATTCIGAFIGQVDASIVQLALPTLERTFDAKLHVVSWVAIGYVLPMACLMPVFARLAEIAGRKLLYLTGFALFGLSSALCGLAPSLPWLIAFRVAQGMSGALLGANSVVILVAAAGAARKSRAMGIFSAAQAVGVSIGPAIGGVLLGVLDWRWVFWVNVPFAAAAVVAGWLVVPVSTHFDPDRRFDLPGALLLTPALVLLLLTLTEFQSWGGLSAATLLCLAALAVLLAGFVWRERRTPAPLLDVRLFRNPAFSGGCVAVAIAYAMLYGMFFAMPFALMRGFHDTPVAAGLHLSVVPIALGLVAPFSGGLSGRHPRVAPILAMAICAAAATALAFLLPRTDGGLLGVMAALAAYGAGLGMFIAPNNTATLGAAPPERTAQAGGLLNLLRIVGTGLGVAAASTVLAWRLSTPGSAGVRTSEVPKPLLLAAIGDVMLMLAALAIIAACATLPRRRA